MKIVIDIPEDDYEFIKDLNAVMGGRVRCKTIQYNVINAIKNGTPVQTGEWIDHGLIDECTNCNKYTLKYSIYGNKYCPNCGASMKRRKEEKNE